MSLSPAPEPPPARGPAAPVGDGWRRGGPWLVLLGAIAANWACSAPPAGLRQGRGGPEQAIVERGAFVEELHLTGELEAERAVAIKAPETSIFQMRIQYMAEEGALVQEGDPLLAFDDSGVASRVLDLETRILDAETRLVAKQAELESALKDLEIELAEKVHRAESSRLAASVPEGLLPAKVHAERRLAAEKAVEELAETRRRVAATRKRGEADVEVLRIERDKLKKDLLKAERDADVLAIESPAAGLVVYERRQGTTARYQAGDSCWPGQTVMRLPDLRTMRARFHVHEVDAPLLAVGTPVRVTVDSFPGRELDGVITHVPSMAVRRAEGSRIAVFEVVCSLSETWQGEMKPGMSVRGVVAVDERTDVPLVSRGRVVDGPEGPELELGGGDSPRRVRIHPVTRNATHYVLAEDEAQRIAALARELAS